MGYACPVCESPQADGGHLANHLAFTAITSGGDHEEWLDERVPDWGELGESELATEVVDDAEEADYPQVFEASGVEDGHDHGTHDHPSRGRDVDPATARERGSGDLDDEARTILEEARSMTEEMRDEVGSSEDETE